MPGPVRYSNPELCEALAARYVSGRMSSLTRRRLAHLMTRSPVLEQAVAQWADRLAPLQDQLPNYPPPTDLWSRIAAATANDETAPADAITAPPLRQTLWQSLWHTTWHDLRLWRLTTLTSTLGLLILAGYLVLAGHPPAPVQASYLAPLSESPGNPDNIALVVSGYDPGAEGAPWLTLQWTRRQETETAGPRYLWAQGPSGQKPAYLGQFSLNDRQWPLEPHQWQALTHSRYLLVSQQRTPPVPAHAEYIGPCLRLADWKRQG